MKNTLLDASMDFSIAVLSMTETITKHYAVANQIERSATSVGANVSEAQYAQSKADFISKMQIALKECYETEYWLQIIIKAHIADETVCNALLHDCGSMRKLLISTINTAKTNA